LPRHSASRRRAATVLAACLGLGLIALPMRASAAHVGGPARTTTKTAPTSALSLPVDATYSQTSNDTAQLIRVPMPSGITPTRVTGRLTFDTNVTGTVQVLADGLLVATVAKDASMTRASVSFPVKPSDVSDGYLQFSLRYLTGGATDPANICIVSNDGTVQLSNVAVEYVGQESAPATLAQFLDKSVGAVSIVTPSHPTAQVQAAALSAAAAISHRYARGVQVSVTTPDDAARAVRTDTTGGREIVLSPSSGRVTATVDQENGAHRLVLAGDAAQLADAAAALGSPDLDLADMNHTSRLTQTGHRSARTHLTLAELGQPAPGVAGLGESQFSVTVRQTDFGSAIQSATVHLVGEHTAVPPSISALIQYRWNGQLVGSDILGQSSTSIDKVLKIPSTQIAPANTLTVQLNAIPTKIADGSTSASALNGPDCNRSSSVLPLAVTFDGKASGVSVRAGNADQPGFTRFPQVLGNVLTVALGNADANTLTDAASLVSELQFANADQLSVRLNDAKTFISSSAPGLLVGATAAQINLLKAPLRMAAFRTIDQDDVAFGAGVDKPFAALQAWYQNGRDILTLSSWAPDSPADAVPLSSHLVGWLVHSQYGWPALYDNLAVAQSATADPVLISSNALVPQPEQLHQFHSYVYWIAGFVAVVILMWLVQIVARRRLRARAAALVDAQEANSNEPADVPDEPTTEPSDT
jgi:hypothetical protein